MRASRPAPAQIIDFKGFFRQNPVERPAVDAGLVSG
jgi:hypothetical protein